MTTISRRGLFAASAALASASVLTLGPAAVGQAIASLPPNASIYRGAERSTPEVFQDPGVLAVNAIAEPILQAGTSDPKLIDDLLAALGAEYAVSLSEDGVWYEWVLIDGVLRRVCHDDSTISVDDGQQEPIVVKVSLLQEV